MVTRVLRYLAPNLVTLSSMIFGLVSLWASHTGDTPLAGWMIIYAVMTDRLDGLLARALRATSEVGMQLDSFADFLNFGIAPAYMALVYLSSRPDLPFGDGTGKVLLFIACGGFMLCAVFRLARYNVLSDDAMPTKMFFGFPTTLSGGTLTIWFLLLLKYDRLTPDFGGRKWFGDEVHTPLWAWKYFPIAIAVGGYLMASRLPMPKVGMTRSKVVSAVLLALLAFGYLCGFAMMWPELIFWMPTVWSIVFLIWGQASARARAMYPPPLFKFTDDAEVGANAKPKTRPQEDLEDLVLDESRPSSDSLDRGGGGEHGTSSPTKKGD